MRKLTPGRGSLSGEGVPRLDSEVTWCLVKKNMHAETRQGVGSCIKAEVVTHVAVNDLWWCKLKNWSNVRLAQVFLLHGSNGTRV